MSDVYKKIETINNVRDEIKEINSFLLFAGEGGFDKGIIIKKRKEIEMFSRIKRLSFKTRKYTFNKNVNEKVIEIVKEEKRQLETKLDELVGGGTRNE